MFHNLFWLLDLAGAMHAVVPTYILDSGGVYQIKWHEKVPGSFSQKLGSESTFLIAKTDGTGAVVERTRRLVEGLGFTAHIEDPTQALVYMQQRYYDPKIGRFLSVDPVGPLVEASGHFGRYHYALNNPYRFIDPDGRCTGSRIKDRDGTCASTGGSTTRSTGEWLDEWAEASAVGGRDAATFGYAFAGVLWDFLGSEKLSQWAAGQGTDPGGIGLELLAVTPVGKIVVGVGAAGRAAFDIAKAGGKHAGFFRNYAGRSSTEIQKGINSLERQIAEHQSWIANPQSKIPNFGSLDARQQAALVNSKWPSDIVRQQKQLDILTGLLNGN